MCWQVLTLPTSQAASFDVLEYLQTDERVVPRMSDPLHECFLQINVPLSPENRNVAK